MSKDMEPTLTITAKDESTRKGSTTPASEKPATKKDNKATKSTRQKIAGVLLPLALLGSVILTAHEIREAQASQRAYTDAELIVASVISKFERSPEFIQIAQAEVLAATNTFTGKVQDTDDMSILPNTAGIEEAIEKVQAEGYAEELLRNPDANPAVPIDATNEFKLAENNLYHTEQEKTKNDIDAGLSLGITASLAVATLIKEKKAKGSTTKSTSTHAPSDGPTPER